MRKIKEMLLLLVLLVVSYILFLMVSFPSPFVVGLDNYIRMFLNDKIFRKALFNTVFAPALFSFLIVAVFAIIVFIVRKKIKVPRWVFYIGSVFVGAITALLCKAYSFISLRELLSSYIVVYSPTVFDVISISNVLLSLYIGIFIAFVFWVLELIVNIIKKIRRKREM
jgi:hypothetical protein